MIQLTTKLKIEGAWKYWVLQLKSVLHGNGALQMEYNKTYPTDLLRVVGNQIPA